MLSEERYIYGLVDPRQPGLVMAVGKTKHALNHRLSQHISRARRNHKLGRHQIPVHAWVWSLLDIGIRPAIILLFTSNKQSWKEDETKLIAEHRLKNPNLLNRHSGGEGRDDSPVQMDYCGKCGTLKKQERRGSRCCPECKKQAANKWYRSLSLEAKEKYLKKVRATGKTEKRKEYERRRRLNPAYLKQVKNRPSYRKKYSPSSTSICRRWERDRRRSYASIVGLGRSESDTVINLAQSLLSDGEPITPKYQIEVIQKIKKSSWNKKEFLKLIGVSTSKGEYMLSKRPHLWPKSDDPAILADYQKLRHIRLVARKWGRSASYVRRAIKRAGGVVKNHPLVRFSPLEDKEIVAAYQSGAKIWDLAKKLDCSFSAIQHAIVRGGGQLRTRWSDRRRASSETSAIVTSIDLTPVGVIES